jgi:hypothetical protein
VKPAAARALLPPRAAWNVEQRIRADLRERRWLRLHAFLLASVCFACSWAVSAALMAAGVDALWLRWGVAVALCYGVFLALLWAWCRWLLSRDEGRGDLPADALAPDGPARAPDAPCDFSSGGGGDFGGAGAGGSFDAAPGADAPSAAAEVTGQALDALGSADEGIVVAVPVAVVIGLAALLAFVFGGAVFALFGVETLLGVAVEIALAGAVGGLAYKAGREGWFMHALSRTLVPMLGVLAVAVAAGAAIDHWMPQARSLPHVIQLLR